MLRRDTCPDWEVYQELKLFPVLNVTRHVDGLDQGSNLPSQKLFIMQGMKHVVRDILLGADKKGKVENNSHHVYLFRQYTHP
ncbi:hypothetical protein Plhal304r1_c022g0077701 [Plasmopara halstedii]